METNLRPLSFGEILDGAFVLYRRQAPALIATVLLTSAAAAVPWVLLGRPLLAAALARDLDAMGAALAGGGVIPLAIGVVAHAVAWCALTHQLSRGYDGRPTSLADGLGAARRSALRVLGAWLIALAAYGVPLLLAGALMGLILQGLLGSGSAGLVLMLVPLLAYAALAAMAVALAFAIVPAVVIEDASAARAVGRSYRLAEQALWRVVGLVVVSYVLAKFVSRGLTAAIGTSAASGVVPSAGVLVAQQALALGMNAFLLPFTAGVTVLAYYDLRIRAEALDLRVAADALSVAGE